MEDRAALESLLDTSRPFDTPKVQLLERLVQNMLTGSGEERSIAHKVLSQLKANTEAWRVVGTILQLSSNLNTRFFALSILEECIATRWKILPEDQKAGVKQYVTDMAITASTDASLSDAKYFVTKVNRTLIQVVKQEWPHNWPTFIPDLCAAAKTNQAICENSLRILCLLSEEVFDFGRDQMTSQRVSVLMSSLNSQFQQIYDLCMFVMQNAVNAPDSINQTLPTVTLQCLAHFLKWIPYGYIFETGLIDILMNYFWDPTPCRVDCVRCLTEIASLKEVPPGGLEKLRTALWAPLVQKLSQISDITMDYDTRCPANSRLFWETFYCQLAICLTTFLRNHRIEVCEAATPNVEPFQLVIFVLKFLVKMTSRINHDETFKICVDYWNNLSENLLMEVRRGSRAVASLSRDVTSPLVLDDTPQTNGPVETPEVYSDRLRHYQPVLNEVRHALVIKMARPQEVCIHYDEETGTVDRDYQADTDEVALYNVMRETLIYLTNLGGAETQAVMTDLLRTFTQDARNPSQKKWNPTTLSRLCWAIGSISGAMSVARERTFVMFIICELLNLCGHNRGKENKAIVASMIMYIFGQYPRFLRSFVWFLENVISKIFEFMQESYKGVQEMACETFLKITKKCSKALALPPPDKPSNPPLIEMILPQLPKLYSQIETHKEQLMLYEGAGHIIAAAPTMEKRQGYIATLMKPFNTEWTQMMINIATAGAHSETVYQPQLARKLTEILRVNERVASATGTACSAQLMSIYQEMLQVYALYSSRISQEVAQHGPVIMSHNHVKAMRSVKRAALLLVQTFVESAASSSTNQTAPSMNGTQEGGSLDAAAAMLAQNDEANLPLVRQQIVQFIMPPLLESVLQDYRSNVPQARDYEVLSLLATLVSKLNAQILPELPRIFDCVFDCTLDMIKTDFHSFPDHRARFYALLQETNTHCFEGLFALPERQRQLFIESLVWAFKHEQPTIAEQGLKITQSLLKNVCTTKAELLLQFCRVFYWSIFDEVFSVLTDTLHKSGFQFQALILMHLVQLVELGRVNDPESHITRQEVMARLADRLMQNFSNLNRKQVEAFVVDLFNKCVEPRPFSQHIRDFLVQLKEFAGSDELFEMDRLAALEKARELESRRQLQVPGLAPQYTPAETTKVEDLE